MDESWGRFWDRLIVDGVTVLVLGFVLQGLWFAAAAALADWRPDLEPGLRKASGRFLALWIAAMVAGLLVAGKRAWGEKGSGAAVR